MGWLYQGSMDASKERIARLEAEALTLSNALNESRKISQERENQLKEEKRLHRLSKMSDANARGTLQQIRDYLGGDADESALAKVERLYRECIERGTAYEVAVEARDMARRERNEANAAGLAMQQELHAANLEIERLDSELADSREQSERIVRNAQEQASISRVQFACTGLIIAICAAAIAFFVGRWAR
jgi:predicted transcriptional regulator